MRNTWFCALTWPCLAFIVCLSAEKPTITSLEGNWAMAKVKRAKSKPDVLEPGEVKRLLAQPNTRCRTGLRNRCVLGMMVNLGLRNAEVRSLAPGDILWETGFVHVKEAKGLKDRTIPLDAAQEELRPWLEAWDRERPKSKWFFPTLKGGQLKAAYLQSLVGRLAARAGINRGKKRSAKVTQELGFERVAYPHLLRHSCASRWAMDGWSVPEIRDLLGHSNIATTNSYLTTRPADLANKAATLKREREAPGDKGKVLADKLGLTAEDLVVLKDWLRKEGQ